MNGLIQPARRQPAPWLLRATRNKLSVAFALVFWCGVLGALQSVDLQGARHAMEAKDYATAEEIYRAALKKYPDSAPVLTDLGVSLQMQGRSAEAMRFYSLALKQKYVPETYALLAQEKCRIGDLGGLKPMLDKIYREERDNRRVLSAVAPCYLDIDEPVQAAELYQTLLNGKEYPGDLALVQLGKALIRSGQFFAARLSKAPNSEVFLSALRQASSDGSSAARSAFPQAARLSRYFRSDLDWNSAVGLWRLHPQDTALLYLLSVLSAEEGMRPIQKCAEQFPSSPYLEQFYADVLADQGHGEEAIAQYEDLVREHPDLSELHYSLGLLHEKREEWAAAEEAFRQQLVKYPNDERALAHLSRCMLQTEQYEALREFLAPRMRVEHPPQWASLNMAEAEQKLGNPQAAIGILVAAEKAPDADKLVHYRLMHLYSVVGRPVDAKREFALFQSASRP